MPTANRSPRLAALALPLLLLASLLPGTASSVVPAHAVLATGSGTLDEVGLCEGTATFVVEMSGGVGVLRWVSDCPMPTRGVNFLLVCQTECVPPPHCAGTSDEQRCEYDDPHGPDEVRLLLKRDGEMTFHADVGSLRLRASATLTIHAWAPS